MMDMKTLSEKIRNLDPTPYGALLADEAAALTAALEEATKWFGNVREYTYDGVLIDMNEAAHKRVMVDARAAIAKAKGEEG